MIIEHHTFRLADGVSDDDFLAADRHVQTEHVPFCTGFVRRTTARGDEGEWLVESLWWTVEDADAARQSDQGAQAVLDGCVDPTSVSVRRSATLD